MSEEKMNTEAFESNENSNSSVEPEQNAGMEEKPKRKRKKKSTKLEDTLSALSSVLGDEGGMVSNSNSDTETVKPLVKKSKEEIKSELVYGEDSIKENDGPNGVRKRPATLLGSDDIRGCAAWAASYQDHT